MSSKRQQILEAIELKLGQINTESGYNTNLGEQVFYWKSTDFEYGEAGAIDFKDPYEEISQNNLPFTKTLLIEVSAIKFSSQLLSDSCNMLEDLVRAIQNETWGGLSTKTRLMENEKSIETSGQTAIKVLLRFQVIYREE